MILSLIGPPCAGKGTQSRIFQENRGFKLIGAGDLLRDAARTDPECAQMLQDGILVPVSYIWNLIEQSIEKELNANPNANILLDGYPREKEQAEFLDKYLQTKEYKLYLINMKVDTATLVERMHHRVFCNICGKTKTGQNILCCDQIMIRRNDDNEESFAQRLNIFNSNIDDVKDFYQHKDTCSWYELDASVSIDLMNAQFEAIIAQITQEIEQETA